MFTPLGNGRSGHVASTLAIASILLFATIGQHAFADNVQNDVSAGGNDTITLGSSTTINYRITANSGDGQNGCNAADASPATVTIVAPASVTPSPGSLTFTSCGTSKPVVFSSTSVGDFEITVSVSDSGTGTYNTNPAKFTLHVNAPPNSAPTIDLPADQDVEGNTIGGADVDFSSLAGGYSAADAEDGDLTDEIICAPSSGSFFSLGGPHSVNCSVQDSLGVPASDSFQITVIDTTDPEITVPGNIVEEAVDANGAAVSFAVTATDIVDASVEVACEDQSSSPVQSGDTFPLGSTTVTCVASDDSGNTASDSFGISVVDTTAPILDLPDDMTLEATGPSGAIASFVASASDSVDGPTSVVCTPSSGSTFSLGTTIVSCESEDNAGNKASGTFSILVQDTTPPELILPSEITEEATGPAGAPVNFVATATDLVDGDVPVYCTPSSGSTFPLGTTSVECTATDDAGNSATGYFDVNVVDTTPPALTLPSDMTLEATGPSGAAASFAATANDLVDGDIPVDCTPDSGEMFSLGATLVNCSSTDAAGNTASGSFTVTVVDTTPPTLQLPSDMTVSAESILGATVSFSATASDIVDGSTTVHCTPASGLTFPIGLTTVSCGSQDNAGNYAEGSFTIKVTVQATGFYQPVDMNYNVNLVKAGSTVPLKFEVFGNMNIASTEISDVSIVKSLKQKLTSCDPTAPTDEVETTATGGTMLRYDPTSGQFVYNWKTPLQKGCYTVTLTLLDDSTIQALFKLK